MSAAPNTSKVGRSRPWQYRNNRVLIVDDQPELHDDFVEMLAPNAPPRASDDLAAAFQAASAPLDPAPASDPFPLPFELSHAHSGEDACGQVEEAWREDRPFALAFVDLRMPPGMDGVEAIQRIRRTDRDLEIVVMTAYSERSLRDIVSSIDPLHKMLYVRKPFTREEIQQITMCMVGKWNVERALAARSHQITANNRTLAAVLDATEDAMAMFDESERLVLANRRFERISGLAREEMTEMSGEALAGKLRRRFREPETASFEPNGNGSLVEGVGPKGLRGLFYRSRAAVRGADGTVVGRLEVYRDVSKDIEVQRMKGEVTRLRGELETTHSFGEMVGGSRGMRELYGLIRQAAASDTTVLIRGETGTGKELVAKSFHAHGPRRGGPFLAVNCAAIPEGLIESELFGHREGSFTGASADRRGAFERAAGGTLFLDEIGDMPPALQAKLLRVLQEREFQRVGGSRARKADVRVLAATNRDLEREVEAGSFRRDLFHRLAVFPVAIPPLRDRREDIPLLAEHFVEVHAREAGKAIDGVSTAALRLLLQHDWPGNVRELINVLERAVLLETSEVVQVESLPRWLTEAEGFRTPPGNGTPRKPRTLAAIEHEALAHSLRVAENNITKAAKILGIHRSTLHRKIGKHGLKID